MIVRIVKMTFKTENVDDFLKLFEETKDQIRNFEGCLHLKLLRDADHPNIFFTYSHWQSANHLNKYRNSPLFADIWPRTKVLFAAKTEAWSTEQMAVLL
jgi:quinol monooxygenase YgiN